MIRRVTKLPEREGAYLMPALPPYIMEPIFEQFLALLPDRVVHHPLGCHKPRIPDRVILEKLVQILVFGCAYRRIAEEGCAATAIRDRRDEWIELGVMEALRQIALSAYDRLIGLELSDLAVDGCITKAPCGGQKAGKSPVDRGKQGTKRSTAVDGRGIPIGGVSAGANWTCVGSVDCLRLRTVRGKENIATNKPDLPTGVSPRSYPAGQGFRRGTSHSWDRSRDRYLRWHPEKLGKARRDRLRRANRTHDRGEGGVAQAQA